MAERAVREPYSIEFVPRIPLLRCPSAPFFLQTPGKIPFHVAFNFGRRSQPPSRPPALLGAVLSLIGAQKPIVHLGHGTPCQRKKSGEEMEG